MGGDNFSFTKIGNMEIQIIPMTRAILGFVIVVKMRGLKLKMAKLIFKFRCPTVKALIKHTFNAPNGEALIEYVFVPHPRPKPSPQSVGADARVRLHLLQKNRKDWKRESSHFP